MLFQEMEVIVRHPAFQRGKYNTDHIEKDLNKSSEKAICLTGQEWYTRKTQIRDLRQRRCY